VTTVRKWKQWGGGVPIEKPGRTEIREFLDWVYERAVADQGTNPGRTANKAREQLRAVLFWAWDQELIDSPPKFPKPKPQRDVAGRHYLTKAEINALYFATHRMKRPRAWNSQLPLGRFWRVALVLFFNYGLDTGTVWGSTPEHGLRIIMPDQPRPDDAVLLGGGSRPNARFQELCALADIKPKKNAETEEDEGWLLKDLRKTCATTTMSTCPSLQSKSSAIPLAASRTGTMPTVILWPLRRS
jgi:hypothetical protein